MRGKGVRMIPFNLIDDTTIRNPRTDLGNIDELVDSFQRNGHLVPLVVRQEHFGGRGAPEEKAAKLQERPKGKIFDIYHLVAGQRRLAAMRRLRDEAREEHEKLGKKGGGTLPFDEVAAVVREGNEVDAKIDQLVENLHRKDMNPIETAEGVKELDNLGYSLSAVAQRIGRSEQWCHQLLAVRNAPVELARAVVRDRMPISVAATIAKKPAGEQKALIEEWKKTAAAPVAEGGGRQAAKRKVDEHAGKPVRMPFKVLRGHLSRLTPSAGGADFFQNDYLNGVRDAWNAVLGVSDIALVNLDKLLPPEVAEAKKKEVV
jgi:ParB family chromosome partitioning protein